MNAKDLRNYVAKQVGFGVETPGAVADNATTETRDTLSMLAAKCETSSQFIYKIQRDAIERDAPYNEGAFLAALMQWAETPENTQRFKLSGWFGIANEYWSEQPDRQLNKANQ